MAALSNHDLVGFALVAAVLLVLLVASLLQTLRLRGELAHLRAEADRQQSALSNRTRLDNAKDEFVSNVSHEIRTPLTSVYGTLTLLSSGSVGKLDDAAAHLVKIAKNNTERMVRLINDILELERTDSGAAQLHTRPCLLAEVVQQAVDTMTSFAANGGVRLETIPETAGSPILFLCDPDRIQQVLCNLLSNAVKFSPAGSTVRVLTSVDGPELELRVEDKGRGIPQEKLDAIFDRFHQLEPADASKKGGSGLGLAICRSIVTQHGGAIQAERNDAYGSGRPGTTFVVRLPRLPTAEIAVAAPLSTTVIAATPALSPAPGPTLVLEDKRSIRRVVGE